MANIIKKVARGLMHGVEEIGEKEAYSAASKIVGSMDKDVESIARKNMGKINDIISQDIKDVGGNFNLEKYLNTNSFQNMPSIENAISRVNKKNGLINDLTSSKLLNRSDVSKAYNDLEGELSFKLNPHQSDLVKSKAYETKATGDEVFSKYYDNYKSVERANNNLDYDIDMSTKKQMFGDRMRRDYASSNKEYNSFKKDLSSGSMSEPINQRIDSIMNSSDNIDDMMYAAYSSDERFNMTQAEKRASADQSGFFGRKKKTMDEAINNKKEQTFEEYTTNKYDKKFNDSWGEYQKASSEEKSKMNSKFGIDDEANAEEKIKDFYNSQKSQGGSFGIGDKLAYYKVPQKAVGVGATAWMVSNMFGTRGQMDNSQLYGQQQPYNGGVRM